MSSAVLITIKRRKITRTFFETVQNKLHWAVTGRTAVELMLGTVSHGVAKQLAHEQYDRFRVSQDLAFESDFERHVKRLTDGRSKD